MMEPETALAVVVGITALGAVTWMFALFTLIRATRNRPGSAALASDHFEIEEGPPPGAITGEAVVDGDPDDLSTKLASQLARDNFSAFGLVKILARDRHQVVFEPATRSALGFRSGRFKLTPDGSRTRIAYAIDAPTGGLLVAGWIALGVGLVALIAAPTLEFLFVLPSPVPQVLIQSIQTVQMVHFLWPPFLFAFLSRQHARMFRARMESLVANLPYS